MKFKFDFEKEKWKFFSKKWTGFFLQAREFFLASCVEKIFFQVEQKEIQF